MKHISGLIFLWLLIPSTAAHTLSSLDRVAITVVNGEEFSSISGGDGFLVGADGAVVIPRLGKIQAAGREETDVERELAERLRYYIKVPQVSVSLVSVSPVSVEVTGAVYRPGQVVLTPETGTNQLEVSSIRTVFNAIKRAGGIRPDADLKAIQFERQGERKTLALGQDAPVITGDRIFIPDGGTSGTTPSQLAPEQITVYVSGVDLPNNTIGAVALKPGASLFRALTAAGATGQNFVRGGRQVLLIRQGSNEQRVTQQFELDRVVSGETDPLLQEGDSIAINGGSVSTAKGIIDFLSPLLSPFTLLFR